MENNKNLLYMQVERELLKEIELLKPDERLPSRNELIKKYGVTRTTIERAISELIGRGYLYAKNGSGTYKSKVVAREAQTSDKSVDSWGVILPDIMSDTYPGILRGVEDVANDNGINVMICNTDNLIKKQNTYVYKLINSRVKGIIIVPAVIGETYDYTAFKKLQESHIPFVFCNRGIMGIESPKVISNNFHGALLATNHLINQGYKNIAFISRPAYSTAIERYQGYMSALSQANIKVDQDYVIFEQSFGIKNPGYDTTRDLLKKHPEIDAIFCFNDRLAEGAYNAITDMNMKVGRDIGIVGYDNTIICEELPIKLTSVKFKTYETGCEAAKLLLQTTKGSNNKNETIILQPQLIIRDSSKKS
ncbi:MAG TPA: hypothetical protein DD426_00115 [Clostridiaceae bacterium]|nr:hypothetical protein [Clostridiaceae bacterium]